MDDEFAFNLFDPIISSIDISNKHKTQNHSLILDSKKPDNELEFFWLTFKDSIINLVGNKNAIIMSKLSAELNELQNQEKYDIIKTKISLFMNTYIDIISKYLLLSEDKHVIMRSHTNINRWTRQDSEFKKNINNFFSVKAIIAISKMTKKKSPHVNYIIKCIVDFEFKKEAKTRIELFEYAIDNNISSIVELLTPYIDFSIYNDNEKYGQFKQMKGAKLVKIIKNKIS
jgi:hypothetical protein